MIEKPKRTLVEIRNDLMALEREMAWHFGYALEQGDRSVANTISDAQVGLHQTTLALGVFVTRAVEEGAI